MVESNERGREHVDHGRGHDADDGAPDDNVFSSVYIQYYHVNADDGAPDDNVQFSIYTI